LSTQLRALGNKALSSGTGRVQAGTLGDTVTLSAAARGKAQGAAASVDYTDRIKVSGNKKIDTLLAGGNRWFHESGASGTTPSLSAKHTLNYSFLTSTTGLSNMDANGFLALDADKQARVRDALSYISSVIDVSFTEVASGGDIQYGSNRQGSSSGYARYPNEGAQVMLANNQASYDTDWSAGTYAWQVVLHETAHTLGLKHPGSYNATGGKTPGPYLPTSQDNRVNTIMSYTNASSMSRIAYDGTSFSRSYVNADSLQLNDVAALQYLYGAATSEAKTFQWSPGAIFSQTIFNNNADSVIDLSNQTQDNLLDLRAGRFSSIAQRDAYADMSFTAKEYAKLKSDGKTLTSLIGKPGYTGKNNLAIAAGSQINRAVGGSGNDSIIANSAANTIDGGAGNDKFFLTGGDATLTGGDGDDTVFLKKKAGAVWRLSEDKLSLNLTTTDKKTKEVTTLSNVTLDGIEHVKYWDGTALKASGKGLLASPLSSKLTVAYSPPSATPSTGQGLDTTA
jgi:Ca2+-binding RTX toxin-like protein